jgi:hypothetical protein
MTSEFDRLADIAAETDAAAVIEVRSPGETERGAYGAECVNGT